MTAAPQLRMHLGLSTQCIQSTAKRQCLPNLGCTTHIPQHRLESTCRVRSLCIQSTGHYRDRQYLANNRRKMFDSLLHCILRSDNRYMGSMRLCQGQLFPLHIWGTAQKLNPEHNYQLGSLHRLSRDSHPYRPFQRDTKCMRFLHCIYQSHTIGTVLLHLNRGRLSPVRTRYMLCSRPWQTYRLHNQSTVSLGQSLSPLFPLDTPDIVSSHQR